MQTIFLVLNYPNDIHIEFLCTSEVPAGKMTCYHFKSRQALCTLVQKGCVNEREATQLLIFFKINTPTFRLTLHCLSTIVGGHEKQSESNTTSTSSSASASESAVSADWLSAPPLRNVRVDTQYKTDKSKRYHLSFWRERKLELDRPLLKKQSFRDKSISFFFHNDKHELEQLVR